MRVAVDDPGPAHGAERVHGVLGAEPPEAGLAEHVVARPRDEGLVQQVEAHGADQRVVQRVQQVLRLVRGEQPLQQEVEDIVIKKI